MKRRSFLQQTGLLLATLGASELGLAIAADRYQRVLAQPTSRKLALLVGINQYRGAGLTGCLTDVELQRELLIHRFRFHPSDILTLTDQQATRSQIETAFINHLVNQAQQDDVVVFHFSGYGNLVHTGATSEESQTSLVTIDEADDDATVSGLTEETLLLLLRSLPTDRVTTILDAGYSYSGSPLQGNLRVRSRPRQQSAFNEAELAFQEQLLAQLQLDRAQTLVQRRSGRTPGVVLSAAGVSQSATEAHWNGFSAGLFTYHLTQQLWHSTAQTTLRGSLGRATEAIVLLVDQKQPNLSGQKSQDLPLKPYHVALSEAGADGVVTAVDDTGIAQVWLAGLPTQVLEHYGVNSLLTIASGTQLQVVVREGLMAKTKILPSQSASETLPQVGQLVREAVRIIPRNVGLTVALDSTLKRIERVDAISAFSTLSYVSAVPAGEQAADCLFSKASEATQVAALPSAPIAGVVPPSGYGLFLQGRESVAALTEESGEAVKLAVKRLVPRLQTLLATKLLNLTANQESSGLNVRAMLSMLTKQPAAQERVLIEQETSRVPPEMDRQLTLAQEGKILTVPVGSRIQYQIQNSSQEPIYFVLLSVNSNSKAFAFYADGRAIQPIAPGEVLTVPPQSPAFEWVVGDPIGLSETQLVCSRAPFSQTQTLLTDTLRSTPESALIRAIANPLEVAQAVLQDLHQASHGQSQPLSADSFALDVNQWATFRFVYQVV